VSRDCRGSNNAVCAGGAIERAKPPASAALMRREAILLWPMRRPAMRARFNIAARPRLLFRSRTSFSPCALRGRLASLPGLSSPARLELSRVRFLRIWPDPEPTQVCHLSRKTRRVRCAGACADSAQTEKSHGDERLPGKTDIASLPAF